MDEEIDCPKFNGIIYIITNKITGDTYIGATIMGLKRRWKAHRRQKKTRNSPLYKAMVEYGSSNFMIEHIASSINIRDLAKLEIEVIKQYNPSYNRVITPSNVWG